MPADLQRAILFDVVPAVREGRVTGGSIDVLLIAKLKACLADPDADLAKPIRIGGKLEPVVRKRLAEIENLTSGARDLVRSAGGLNDAIAYIFRDKLFRNHVRQSITSNSLQSRLNFVISGASGLLGLDDHTPAASGTEAYPGARPSAPALKRAVADEDRGKPPASAARAPAQYKPAVSMPLPRNLAGYAEMNFGYKFGKEEWSGRLGELVSLLSSPADHGRAAAQMAGMLASDAPQVLIRLADMAASGEVEATPEAAALLRVFAARVYLQFNAVESAMRVGRELYEDGDAFARLTDGEKVRLRNLLARCALRSGRGAEAVELYSDIFAENPGSAGALMNVVGSAFAIDPGQARSLAKVALLNGYAVSDSDLTFIGDILTSHGDFEPAEAAFFRILQRNAHYFDGHIGLANLYLARGLSTEWRRQLRRYFQLASGVNIDFDPAEPLVPFSLRPRSMEAVVDHPRVTIVMTTFNAGDTVDRAIASVLGQVLADIELIVVDDCSEDDSRERVIEIAKRDARVKWIHNDTNVGTYVSKNKGIAVATGEYVTFHDSDDWMHPKRLLTHLEAMRDGHACTTSNWLRMDVDGHVIVRRGGPYTHLNPASTFMPRSLFERLGPFDAVRTGADSEILGRIRMSLGQKSVANLPSCLGLGLHHENSLTQSGAAAFDEFRYSPVRLAYTEQWLAWQLQELASGPRDLKLVHPPGERHFPIPEALSPHQG